MNDVEYVRRLGIIYEKVLSLRKDDNYVINQPQMDRFLSVLNFFLDMADEGDDEVEKVNLIPKNRTGDITARFLIFNVAGDEVFQFCKVMSYCTAIGFDPTTDGRICISCTVPDVFITVEQKKKLMEMKHQVQS